MNIIIKDLFSSYKGEKVGITKDIFAIINNLSQITHQLHEGRTGFGNPTYLIEYGYPPGGGHCISCKLEVVKKLPVSKEFETVTGLKGEIKVAEASIGLKLSWVEMTDDEIHTEVLRIQKLLK
jgi:hypothetical protein